MKAASTSLKLAISSHNDVLTIRNFAIKLASEIGFNAKEQEDIALVIKELASNLIKHAIRGTISLQRLNEENRTGLYILSNDSGPGFNVKQCLSDGYSTFGTLGYGLGTINRLVDELEILSGQENNNETDIICKKWLPLMPFASRNSISVDIGLVSKPKRGQDISGDVSVVLNGKFTTLIALIDGLGHGLLAAKAANASKLYIQNHQEQSLPLIFQGVDRACNGTNGVVMAIAKFDWLANKLFFASVGNIETKIVGSHEKINLPLKRGILGRDAPSPKIIEVNWQSHYGLLMHSDGFSNKWNWADFSYHANKSAQFIANLFYHKVPMRDDDATILYMKLEVQHEA